MDAGRVFEALDAYEKCSCLNPWDPSIMESLLVNVILFGIILRLNSE